jgi:hypothetical protein
MLIWSNRRQTQVLLSVRRKFLARFVCVACNAEEITAAKEFLAVQ